MSERKEAPDCPGRWWVKREAGNSYGLVVQRDDDGELHNYILHPGDQWQNVDALEAERDAAKKAAEQLRESNANLLANFEAQTKQNRTLQNERDYARDQLAKREAQFSELLENIHAAADRCGVPAGPACLRLQCMAQRFEGQRSNGEVSIESLLTDAVILCHQSESDARDFIRLANIVVDVTLSYGEASRAT